MKPKRCPKCEIEKPVSEFHNSKKYKDGLDYQCSECKRAEAKVWYYDNREKESRRHRTTYVNGGNTRNRIFLYGPHDFDKMYAEQKGCCAICGRHQSELKKALGVDHNHITKKIRSLLCNKCNSGLGLFQDDSKLLSKASKYLRGFE